HAAHGWAAGRSTEESRRLDPIPEAARPRGRVRGAGHAHDLQRASERRVRAHRRRAQAAAAVTGLENGPLPRPRLAQIGSAPAGLWHQTRRDAKEIAQYRPTP